MSTRVRPFALAPRVLVPAMRLVGPLCVQFRAAAVGARQVVSGTPPYGARFDGQIAAARRLADRMVRIVSACVGRSRPLAAMHRRTQRSHVEPALGRIASLYAGASRRSVQVRCWADADWTRIVRIRDAVKGSLEVLMHEASHVAFPRQSEAFVECRAMQGVTLAGRAVGTSRARARALAEEYWALEYPQERGSALWTPRCREDGPLDFTPYDGDWP